MWISDMKTVAIMLSETSAEVEIFGVKMLGKKATSNFKTKRRWWNTSTFVLLDKVSWHLIKPHMIGLNKPGKMKIAYKKVLKYVQVIFPIFSK